MKRTITILTAAFALVITIGVAAAQAQLNPGLKADVPFAFTVGNTALAPGEYKVAIAGQPVIRLSGEDGSAGVVGMPSRDDAKGQAKLVFHKYGNQYFLAEVWTESKGIIIVESAAEREMSASTGIHGFDTLAILLHAIR